MAHYQVLVRDYHWVHHNIVAQSPVLDLNSRIQKLIIRPLEGRNNQEPRIISSSTELTDDIRGHAYRVEAHGVVISTNSRNPSHFPAWVPVQNGGCEDGEVYVVNLMTHEAFRVRIAHVCWVPGFEASDRRLYTIIGAPRKTIGAIRILALVQQLGRPRESKLALLTPSELSSFAKISDVQKKALFEIQLRAIKTESNPPLEPLLNGYRIFCSPYRDERNRHTLDEIMVKSLEVHRPWDAGSEDIVDSFDDEDDDDLLSVKPIYPTIVEAPTRPYSCDCRYSALRPTCYNPRPAHRHGTDKECSLGSAHAKHCIFADYAPKKCIVPSPGDDDEPHQHCVDPILDMQSAVEEMYGTSCFAEAEALLEWADTETGMGMGMDMDMLDYAELEDEISVDGSPLSP